MIRKALLLLLAVLVGAGTAWAQDVSARFQGQVIGSRGLPLANQNVAICTQPANTTTQPCSPLATLATSTTTTSGGANPLTTDTNGNFFFYAAPGKYTVQVYGPQVGTPFVQPDTLVGASGPASVTTLTVSGAATFTNLDDILWVGTGGYANIAAAETAAGATNKTIIAVRSTYTGTDCPTYQSNIVIWDFRGNATPCGSSASGNVASVNNNDGNVYSGNRDYFFATSIASTGSIVSRWMVTGYFNGTNGNLVDGSASWALTGGTLSGTLSLMRGAENIATIESVGGTVTTAAGTTGAVSTATGSTTALGTGIGLYGLGCQSLLGATPTNCYGVYGLSQHGLASGKNYSGGFEGPIRLIWTSPDAAAGLDMDDNGGVPHPFVRMTSASNRSDVQAINTNGLGINSSDGVQRALVTSSGLAIQNTANATGLQLFNTTTTCTTGNTVGATCTTAAISLPVAEADTSYRVVCTGKGITNVPVVIATTNSSATQFTITIAALTAAAASFTSYDCTAGHN